jgi:protein TonB
MLTSKFDLYKDEWLDLVFTNRNKEYGAYDLRHHYNRTMATAMGLTFAAIAIASICSFVFHKAPPIERPIREIIVPIGPLPPIEARPKQVQPKTATKPLPTAPTTRFVPLVVTSNPVDIDPPKPAQINGAIGPVESKGPGGDGQNVLSDGSGSGEPGPAPKEDVSIHNTFGLESMPEPVGGDKAWAKFLMKNLHFPVIAQEQGVSGKVFLSFVIEKDGKLSNIVVEKGAGYGFDEEAVRVLKLAPAWKPGIQNGQPVRVKYTVPITFQLSE